LTESSANAQMSHILDISASQFVLRVQLKMKKEPYNLTLYTRTITL